MSELSNRFPEPAIDGPWRVDIYGARFIPARNGGGFEELRFFERGSMAFYGSFDDPSLDRALRHSMSWIGRQRDSIQPLILSRFGLMDLAGEWAENGSIELQRTMSPRSLDELQLVLLSLVSYGERYLQLLKDAGLTWSPNGKYLVALIPLGRDELDSAELRDLLLKLAGLAELTPLRPIFIVEDARRLDPQLQQMLNWQAFLGADQMGYARDRYAMEIAAGMVTRVAIGVAVDRSTESARTLNGLSYEPTVDSLEQRRAIVADAANYSKFLEGLTDGS